MQEEIKLSINKIATYLKSQNFQKKLLTWSKEKKEFVLSIDLQKSSWSQEYYVNVGITLDKIDVKSIKTYKSDIRYRVSSTNKQGNYKDIYKLEEEADNIIDLIKKEVIDRFSDLETLKEVKEKILSSKEEYYILTEAARKKLHIEVA